MKKFYALLFVFTSFFAFSQMTPVSITSVETYDLSAYTGATNFAGQAEYFVYKSSDDVLDKPIFLIDGFDPGDSRNIDALYASLDYTGNPNFTNLGDELRAEGFDIVVVNFPQYMSGTTMVDGGADFIERNALTLVELIQVINTEKALASSPEQNVIIGPSMGGLISRFALNFMEDENIDADTRLWVSLDSPHLGANVPIGLQHQFNYLAYNSNAEQTDLQPIIDDVLNSPAARQLLVDHFESHLDSSNDGVTFDPLLTLPIPHPYRIQFESNINELTASGFPENCRKIAVTNGSGIGTAYLAKDGVTEVSPGFVIIPDDFNVMTDVILPFLGTVTLTIDIDISMTPEFGSPAIVSNFDTTVPFVGNINSNAQSGTTNYDGVDAAPGGLFDISGLSGDLPMDGLAADFLDALTIDKFSFIPTVSALALEITDQGNNADNVNWYHDIDLTSSRATTNNTPFDNTYLPDNNEDHVAITSSNAAFVLSEIRGTVLGSSNEEIISFQLEKNPIKDNLVLLSNQNQNATISIIDYTGKLIFKSLTELNNRTEIPVNLNSGFYILNVKGEDNNRFTTKFIVN